MGLNLEEKKALVVEVGAKVAQAQAIVLAEYRSLDVGAITDLRAKARGADLLPRSQEHPGASCRGGDPVRGARPAHDGAAGLRHLAGPSRCCQVLNDFAKGNDKLVIRAGAMRNQVMNAREIATLASMPSRLELVAKLMGTMQAPIAKFARTLNEVPSKFVRTLAAVRDQQEKRAA